MKNPGRPTPAGSAGAKTSASHPLRIDNVDCVDVPGVIGMTLCPGRKGSSLEGGHWDRDLGADLDIVRSWHPNLAVSLLEEHEYSSLGLPDFRDAVSAAGLPWLFLPIPDGGVPGPTFLDAWAIHGPHVRNILRGGGRVLIHCRAGLGRTGLLAASLLVELGMDADDAIRLVRARRPGAIETRAQEAYVRACRAVDAGPSRSSRIAGTMYGAAIGDALGSAFEFLDAPTIERALGEPFAWQYISPLPGSLLGDREPGWPTDDTAMALSVAHTVAGGCDLTAVAFADAFLTDLDRATGRFGKMFWQGAPGGATTRALGRLAIGADPATCGDIDDGGNGAAMRSHPIGVLRNRDEVLAVAGIQAKVTHGEPAAVAAAQAVAVLVHDAMAGFEPSLEPPAGIDDAKFLQAWRDAHSNISRDAGRLPEHLLSADMSGWSTVATAHAISYVYQSDPTRAIAAAAASGGDTDTVASIVGALVGARSGVEALELTLIEGLKARSEVHRVVGLLVDDRAAPMSEP